MIRLPLGKYFEELIDWLNDVGDVFFENIKDFVEKQIVENLETGLLGIPWWVFIIAIVIIGFVISGYRLAIGSGLGLLVIYSLDLWEETMQTLSIVITSTIIALLIGIPLGIFMAKSKRVEKIFRPILDFMQTMPAFVYLIPSVIFFGLGAMSGAVSTVIFAMPPVVRLTCLGIQQVPEDVIEAAKAFGSTPFQMLIKVQIPLAMPTILTGINQTIMLSLSMVVVSAMIGVNGLGKAVYTGVTSMQIGQGFEGGIAVVILAIILDRLTQSAGNKPKKKKINK